LIGVCVLTTPAAAQQTTAFTYQGKLTDAGNPANGNYDLQIKLFDTATVSTGVQQGATVVRNPVTASVGLFGVQLDFGSNVFSGADRYLEIGVRPAGNGGAYTVLAPRQPITAAPYAIQTLNAEKLGGLPASGFVQNSGTGTVNAIPLWSSGTALGNSQITQSVNGVQLPNGVQLGLGAQLNQVQFGSPNSETGMSISGASGRADLRFDGTLKLVNGPGGPPPATNGIAITTAGNVGIGTTNPFTKLHILSNVAGVSAILGESGSGRAVWGQSTSSSGVYGESGSGRAVWGQSTSGSGVYGESAVSSLTAGGVYGRGTGSGSIGVIGESNINNAVGVFGVSTSTSGVGVYARNFSGGRALFAEGDAAQSRDKGGLVKAVAYVRADGAIFRCFNSQLASSASTVPCGFSVNRVQSGFYEVNLGFPVSDRFFSITPRYRSLPTTARNAGANFGFGGSSNAINVFTFATDDVSDTLDADFMIIVY